MSDPRDVPSGPPHDTTTETHGEPRDTAADEHSGAVHGADDHGADHGHDDHGHDEEPLGPIDREKWAAGIAGVAIAVVVAACFGFSTGAL